MPPQPSGLLYKNLFDGDMRDITLDRLSKGLDAIVENAKWLLEDAKVFADAKRYTRADFLVATAEEEIAKSYILLDACRLDFTRHKSVLKRLCRAFYSHVEKYAYYKVAHFDAKVHFHDMKQVREFFHNELVRWWPSADMESGEPDMPHETYFKRELNLYVDFNDCDQQWTLVRPDEQKFIFDKQLLNSDPISDCYNLLNKLLDTRDKGLYKPEALNILNEIFKNQYITECTPTEQLLSLYKMAADKIGHSLKITSDQFEKSALKEWPLYHFLQDK